MTRVAVVWLGVASLAGVARAQEPEASPVESERPPGEETTPPAPAQASPIADDTRFGSGGQVTISDDLRLSATRLSGSGTSSTLTQIQLTPAFDFFSIPNLSFGGQLVITYVAEDSSSGSDTEIELGMFARVGYNVPISATASLWPRVALGVRHVGSGQTATTVPLQVFVPFVFQAAAHFFFGVGPILVTDLVSKENGNDAPRMTTIGVQSTLGGYFRGR
jgi:hypothetical protein